jgi:hypothetical protein
MMKLRVVQISKMTWKLQYKTFVLWHDYYHPTDVQYFSSYEAALAEAEYIKAIRTKVTKFEPKIHELGV